MRSSHRGSRDNSETGQKQKEPRAGFRLHNGVLALHLDNKPQVPFVVDVQAETSNAQIAACAAGGARLFRLRNVDLGWNSPNRSEFEALDSRVARLLENAPNSSLLLEINVEAPEWWRRAHKAECAVYCLARTRATEAATLNKSVDATATVEADVREQGSGTTATISAATPTYKINSDMPECASRASRRWLLEAGDALGRLVQYVAEASWGERCIGFQIAGGENGGWRHPEWARMPDIGPRMSEQFRSFCLTKYRRNGGLLKKEWDDPRADFDRIKCPDAYERRYADMGMLRDPMRSRRMLDYFECFYTAQNDAALHFCAIAKRAGGGRLVGIAYADILGTMSNAEGGWGLPEAVFDAENVDYIVSGAGESNKVGVGALTGSLKLRGKFVFLTAREGVSAPGNAATAMAVSAGALLPALLSREQTALIMSMGERAVNAPAAAGKRGVQVALIVDAFGQTYIAGKDEARAEWQRSVCVEQFQELTQTGAQMEAYLLSDLFHPKFPDHKVTVFLNTLYLTEAERRKIDARVKRGQQVAVWLWGAGVLSETGVDAEAGGRLIGMKLRSEKNATSLRMRIVEGNDPLTWGLHIGAKVGPERAVVPTLTIGDKTATRLGANSANKTTFATKRSDTWTSVHYGTLPVPANLLRNAMRVGGVHLYAESDGAGTTVTANARLVVVSSLQGGTLKVFLPGVHEVTDASSKTPLTVGSDVSVTFTPNGTRILELKPIVSKANPPG